MLLLLAVDDGPFCVLSFNLNFNFQLRFSLFRISFEQEFSFHRLGPSSWSEGVRVEGGLGKGQGGDRGEDQEKDLGEDKDGDQEEDQGQG